MEGDARVLYYWGPLLQCKPIITSSSKYLLAALESTIKVFNTDTGSLIKTLKGHKNEIVGIVSVPEKEEFLSCDEMGKVCHWNLTKEVKKNNLIKEIDLEVLDEDKKNAKVVSFNINCSSNELIVGAGKETGKLLKYSAPFTEKPVVLVENASLGQSKVAVSECGNFLAFLRKRNLEILSLSSDNRVSHHYGVRELVCLACHPSRTSVATGDSIGQIILWYNLFGKAVKQTLHWHSQPVADLAFSHTGSELYSGGGECVLVKWYLTEDKQSCLPRLGMPIKYVMTDSKNSKVICAHCDSGFTVVSARDYKLLGSIQGVSLSIDIMEPYPAGFTYDPRTKAVILNGKSGHVQFYDLHNNKLLYQLDIVRENYINPERNVKLYNNEVEKVAISPDGNWLATVVFRDDFEYSREVQLIFWFFDSEKQSWTLNTSIHMPHDKYVNGLTFMPASNSEGSAVCVSCSDDGKFKVWEVIDNSDIYGQSNMWGCRNVGFYRHLPATAVTIAPDGSLIAVGFANILTIWTSEECHLKGTLSQPYLKEHLRQIEFGRTENCSSMIISRSDNWLCGWNLFTCSLSWRVMINSVCMAVDPMSSYMAVFSKNCDAFIFEPQNTLVSTRLENINSKPIICAAFVPRQQKCKSNLPWTEESQLFIIDEAQRLKLIEPRGDIHAAEAVIDGVVQEMIQDTAAQPTPTPFSSILAQTKVSHAVPVQSSQWGSAAFGVNVENSSALLQQVLGEARVYRLETFTSLSREFCKLVIPDAITSAEKEEEEILKTRIEQKEHIVGDERKIAKKKKKWNMERVMRSNFNDLMNELT